ncbi:hypothetical protein [Bosea sp. NBC_00550]|uniref:hypothetical protein n=1 Tax=Bosea sp. NBC_00550 TaxID=2969621 RepID=UPI00222EC745|nr:hypothetical protein [Bosea sp. NBC_00550]UZF94812.1 hypothetical protein NWE53_11855 [Bosea sp. NBC_00550]
MTAQPWLTTRFAFCVRIAMAGQIVDFRLLRHPGSVKGRDQGRAYSQAWKERRARLRQRDRDARWTLKFTKARRQADGTMPPVDIAIPAFGYQNHIAIDREHGRIRRWLVTDAAAYEGERVREGLLKLTDLRPFSPPT